MAKYALALLIPAIPLSAWQLTSLGRVSAVVMALDAVAGALLPFGLLSLGLAFAQPNADVPPAEDDGDDGGGSHPEQFEPLPPTGGLEIDWERFETEVCAYAQGRQPVAPL